MRSARIELLAVFTGGAIGTLLRVALFEAFAADPASWPWATFAANVAGAALLGFLVLHPLERHPLFPYEYGGPLLGTGLCGALTTFSGLQLELLEMLDEGHGGLALAYTVTSVAAGWLAVVAASRLTVRRWGPR